jgi:integrase/recombinase XerC
LGSFSSLWIAARIAAWSLVIGSHPASGVKSWPPNEKERRPFVANGMRSSRAKYVPWSAMGGLAPPHLEQSPFRWTAGTRRRANLCPNSLDAFRNPRDDHRRGTESMSRYDEDLIAPRTLTEREQRALLRVSGEHRAGFRDHLIFAIAFGTGLREHEIVALDVGDVFDEAGRARRRVALRVFKRSNSDRAQQQILLSETIRTKLEKFRTWKRGSGESLEFSAPLFVSRKANRLSKRQLRRLVHVWQQRAGADVTLNFHALRHTAITNYYRLTRDPRGTQKFSRHSSLQLVTRYTHPTDEDQARAIEGLLC